MTIVRINGSVYKHDTVVKSTEATSDTIRLPTLMPEAEQHTEVKRRAAECLSTLETDEQVRPILIKGGESIPENAIDPDRDIEHNKGEIMIRQDGTLNVTAVLHRPLRAAML